MKRPPEEVSPANLLADELDALKKLSRATVAGFGERMEAGIARVRDAVGAEAAKARATAARVRDLRDMLALIRMLEVKPEKGRRRDLKRLENLVADLEEMVERWS